MTSIIKAQDATAISAKVRPLPSTAVSVAPLRPEPVVPPEVLSLRREVEALTSQLASHHAEVERLKTDVGRAFREGEGEGRKAGLREAQDSQSAALARLERGIDGALGEFGQALSSLDRLAALLAREGLVKVLGEPGHYAEMVGRIVRRQLDLLDAQSLVRVEVSKVDFPDQERLAELAASLGRSPLELRTSDEIEAGGCRIKLTLGALEVGVDQQWSSLSAVLQDLAEPGARA
jgi:flagellar biosynthesis/type III secretory pathway protein FliH